MKLLNKSGFTLIELLIVISLFALLTFLASANLSFFDRLLVRSELEKLHMVCRYLQRCAIVSGQEQYLIFDNNQHAYTYDEHHEKLPPQIRLGFLSRAQGPPGSANKPIHNAITFSGNRIVFYPTGIISAGTVYLIDRSQQSMYALSNAVSQVSYLRMYQYDGKWNQII